MITMPIIVLFFQEHGLSLTEIMILQAGYSISVAVFEIPSGYISDVFGRKKTIILSTIFCFIGYILFSFYSGFLIFLIAEIMIGIGGSLMSGSDSAIIYDTLLEIDKKDTYTKIEGRNYAIGNFSEATAGVIGGVLASTSIYFPVYAQTFVLFFSIPIAFLLIEPNLHRKNLEKGSLSSVISILNETFVKYKKLKWLIIFSSIMGVATLSIAWFCQPFFNNIGIPIIYFGVIWALLNLSVGVTSFNSHLFEKKMKPLTIMSVMAFLMPLCFFLLAYFNSFFSLLFILLIYLLRGLVTPILRTYININTTSDRRATVLSIRSFMIRISFAIIAPSMAYISEITNLMYAFYIIGFIVASISLLSVYKLSNLD